MTAPVITGPGLWCIERGGHKARITHIENGYAFGFLDDRVPGVWQVSNGQKVQWLIDVAITGPWHEPVEGWALFAASGNIIGVWLTRELAERANLEYSKSNLRVVHLREPHDEPAK